MKTHTCRIQNDGVVHVPPRAAQVFFRVVQRSHADRDGYFLLASASGAHRCFYFVSCDIIYIRARARCKSFLRKKFVKKFRLATKTTFSKIKVVSRYPTRDDERRRYR